VHPRVAITLLLAGILALAAIVLVARTERGRQPPVEGLTGVERPGPSTQFAGSPMPPRVRAPGFALSNQDGDPIAMRDFRGEPVAVTFLYTRCEETCPPQAQQIKGALVELEEDVPTLAIALEPERDTPASAREFLSKQGMTGKMDFVLGSRGELERVWCGFAILPQIDEPLHCGSRVVRPDPSGEHQAWILLVDDGYQRVGSPLEQATPERIAHDVRVLRDD
jgi:protein SCO1